MLIELFGRNFGCFRDEFRLSMLATDIDPDSDRGIVEVNVEGDDEPIRLLRAVALYGPNASGKSTLIRAAGALRRLLSGTSALSSDSPVPGYHPFALGPQSVQPITLGAKAVIDSVVYDYVVSFDQTAVHSERLLRLSGGPQAVLLNRTGQNVVGRWKHDPQFELISAAFRQNALLLSLADSLTPKLAKSIAVGFTRMLTTREGMPLEWRGGTAFVALKARDDAAFANWLLARLRSADVGVVDLHSHESQEAIRVPTFDEESGEEYVREGVRVSQRLTLLHGGNAGNVPLPYSSESRGTKRLVELAPMLYDLMRDQGRAVFIDEIDASIHPLLLQDLVRHFNSELPMQQIRGQLIFATHETALLDDEARDAVLRRDQVYLTEKDSSGASKLISVAEFKERNNLNMRRRYLQGRYGALPSLGTFAE